MGTIAEKLAYLAETKELIKDAIEAKGVGVQDNTPFRKYADLILQILNQTESEYFRSPCIVGLTPKKSYNKNFVLYGSEVVTSLLQPKTCLVSVVVPQCTVIIGEYIDTEELR